MLENNGTTFRVQIDPMHDREWSLGIALTHWCDETYLCFNLILWRVSIGILYKDI